MTKYVEKVENRFVIATVDTPTMYATHLTYNNGYNRSFTYDIKKATKYTTIDDALVDVDELRDSIYEDVECVVIPMQIEYSLICESE